MKRIRYWLVLAVLCTVSIWCHGQTIISLIPNSSVPGRTVDVVVRGVNTNFQNNVSRADFGPDITVQKFVVSNSLTGTATISINSGAAAGYRSVKITTGVEVAEIDNYFEVFSDGGSFKANINILPIESISLSDLDLTVPASAPIMFFVNIYNDNANRNVNIDVSLSASKGNIGKISLTKRSLTANAYTRITNRDFTSVSLNGPAGSDFQKALKMTGTFPPDNYTYQLQIKDENGNVLATDEVTTVVTNPVFNPELIMPGTLFSHELESIYTPFPLFQWFGQNDKYDFAIYKVLEGQTPEDVVRNIPVYKQTDITGTNFLYPNFAEKLVNGRIYAWQINGKVQTSKGVQYLPSQVFRFMYSDPAATTGSGNNLVAKVQVTPQQIQVGAGQQFQFRALFYDKDSLLMSNVVPVWQVTPPKGTITSDGVFTAGKLPATVAVIVASGTQNDFATVTIMPDTSNFNEHSWMIRGMLKQLFGIPDQTNTEESK